MHVQAFDFVRRATADSGPRSVLEVGSLDVNGGIRSLFPGVDRYHGIDVVDGPGVDEVADAADWRPDHAYDLAVSTEVLEHTPRWHAVLSTMWTAVAPGGAIVMTCATDPRAPHSAVDGLDVREGEHYRNVLAVDVRDTLERLGCTAYRIDVYPERGDLYLVARRDQAG